MKISTKLTLFYVGVVVVFCLLAVTLVSQLRSLAGGYDRLLGSQVHSMEQARVIQVDFKKQVQEWKDILLRGHNPDDLATYTKQFREKQSQVDSEAEQLARTVEDPECLQLLAKFLQAHRELDEQYQRAYAAYVDGNADFKAADRIVRGKDRPPTDLFDRIVSRLDTVVKQSVAAQQQASARARNLAIGTAGGLLLLLGIAGAFIVRSILGRIGRLKTISDRLAVADISGLVIDISGKDEISDFGSSMKGVHAAIEELLKVSSAA